MQPAGAAIRVLREARGLTVRELAEMAQISRVYLWRIEQGHRNPSPKVLRQITQALGRDLAERAA